MIKEQKAIINKDIKKYRQLVEHTEGKVQDIYLKVLASLEKIIEEER